MTYLVDTNVISELRKGQRCNPGVASWFAGVTSEDIFLSSLVLGELRKGIESLRRRDEPAAKALEDWFGELVATHSDRILPVDQAVAEQWGRFNVPDPLPVVDGLLAATASVNGMTLVTRNVSHVERTGVEILNPFSA
jgi:predicted nucleic acid-binding protein